MNEAEPGAVTRISFVRHGRVHNPNNIFYGRLPGFKLSPEGRQDAIRAARVLKNLSVKGLYSSPLLRARQTANEILKYHPHLKLKTSKYISEIVSPYQGADFQWIESNKYDVYTDCEPGFEQPVDILKRTRKFVQRVRTRHPGDHVAAVTHGDLVLFMMVWIKGLRVVPRSKIEFKNLNILNEYPATGSITTLTYITREPDEVPGFEYLNPSRRDDPF